MNQCSKHVRNLLEQMTLEEKIGQMFQIVPECFKENSEIDMPELTGPLTQLGIDEETIYRAGSVIGAAEAEDIREIQTKYLAHSRLKIPLLFMMDVIHGMRTGFPIPLALSCSFDPEVIKTAGQVMAREAAASGIHVTFAPMCDISRDPRWGRIMESAGEDPYLASQCSEAWVRGIQGDGLDRQDTLAACLKHFVGYGLSEGGRDYDVTDLSEWKLHETYLPPFKAGINAQAAMVMSAFCTYDGIPVSANRHLMRDILRDELMFEGMLISDWGAVYEIVTHGAAENTTEAAKKAILAGVDMEMMSTCYVHTLSDLIKNGDVPEAYIDEAVTRILSLKEQLGLFENPYRGMEETGDRFVTPITEHREKARMAAARSMVLLKNEGNVLPLSTSLKRIAVIGPLGDSGTIVGAWECKVREEEAVTLLEGIRRRLPDAAVSFEQGCGFTQSIEGGIERAVHIARQADVVILALGENKEMSGECTSKTSLELPVAQLNLMDAIAEEASKTVGLLFNGRPMIIEPLLSALPAVLECWMPGTEGGNAAADILFGGVNPSGRLSVSFPRTVGQVPVYYARYNTGRPSHNDGYGENYVLRYIDSSTSPLLPFGYGLSYTQFTYGELKLSKTEMAAGENIQASIDVVNSGEVPGTETVQLYIRDCAGSTIRPLKELKQFKQITLLPGKMQTVCFDISSEMLKCYTVQGHYEAEPGIFKVFVGHDSASVREESFTLK